MAITTTSPPPLGSGEKLSVGCTLDMVVCDALPPQEELGKSLLVKHYFLEKSMKVIDFCRTIKQNESQLFLLQCTRDRYKGMRVFHHMPKELGGFQCSYFAFQAEIPVDPSEVESHGATSDVAAEKLAKSIRYHIMEIQLSLSAGALAI